MAVTQSPGNAKVVVYIYNKYYQRLVDYTEQIESITWSGDEETEPRTLEVTMMNTVDLVRRFKHQGFNVGDAVYVYYNNKEIFRGTIFSKTMTSDGRETFTAYDILIYLAKSQATILYRNINASDLVKDQLRTAGIRLGSIADIHYKIKKLLAEGENRNEIVKRALEEVKTNTGKRYKIRTMKGVVDLIEREKAAQFTIGIENVISSSNTLSMEEMANRVVVTKGSLDDKENKFVSVMDKNQASIDRYGMIQHVIEADEKASLTTMKNLAKQYLLEHNVITSEISIDFIGSIDCITGNKIRVFDRLTGLSSDYYISADSHTFSNGVHTMTLQLSRKLV